MLQPFAEACFEVKSWLFVFPLVFLIVVLLWRFGFVVPLDS